MKGRLTQDKINAAIDEIHTILEAKYKIVSIPMSKLSGTNLKKWKVCS